MDMERHERHGRDGRGHVDIEGSDAGNLQWSERAVCDPRNQAEGDHHRERSRESVPTSAVETPSHDHRLPRGEHEQAEAQNAVQHAHRGGGQRTPHAEAQPPGPESTRQQQQERDVGPSARSRQPDHRSSVPPLSSGHPNCPGAAKAQGANDEGALVRRPGWAAYDDRMALSWVELHGPGAPDRESALAR
jgi:hypothetical protein